MKVNKKIIGLIALGTIIVTMFKLAENGREISKEYASNNEVATEEVVSLTIDLNNLNSYEDIKNAYSQYFEKIMNKEPLRDLNSEDVTLDTILDYANKGVEIVETIEKNGDKISTIEKLVVLNDLANNTTLEVVKDTLRYVIDEYENGNLEKDPIKNLYITRFLDVRLDKLPNLSKADSMVFDMYQICKDSIRGLTDSIESNKDQVHEVIEFVKRTLN